MVRFLFFTTKECNYVIVSIVYSSCQSVACPAIGVGGGQCAPTCIPAKNVAPPGPKLQAIPESLLSLSSKHIVYSSYHSVADPDIQFGNTIQTYFLSLPPSLTQGYL